MGWYPCCCSGKCEVCDCFPCGVRFKLSQIVPPPYKCDPSELTDDVWLGEWIYVSTEVDEDGKCVGEYSVNLAGPTITVPPPTPPATESSPPFPCGPCTENTLTVTFRITITASANCGQHLTPPDPCTEADFGGSRICQYCAYTYRVEVFVKPTIAGSVTQDNESWLAIGHSWMDPERCDDIIDEAKSRGFPICTRDMAETYLLQHTNLVLCDDGIPIFDFSSTSVTLEPTAEVRSYLGQDCGGGAGCACWWQFNPVASPTPPCTTTTDPSFVNCIDVTFNTGWYETDWDEDGTIPSTDGWWTNFNTLNCSDLDNRIVRAVQNPSTPLDNVPCYWTDRFQFSFGAFGNPRDFGVFFRLRVLPASEVVVRGIDDACWDSKGYGCTSVNSWLVPDPALATYANYKFVLDAFIFQDGPLAQTFFYWGGKYRWVSQNDFALADIWTLGAIAGNPLKPFEAYVFNQADTPTLCALTLYSASKCIFTDPATIAFPTTRAEEMHCRANHIIPDVTIGPVICPP